MDFLETLLAFREWREIKREMGEKYDSHCHLMATCQQGDPLMLYVLLGCGIATLKTWELPLERKKKEKEKEKSKQRKKELDKEERTERVKEEERVREHPLLFTRRCCPPSSSLISQILCHFMKKEREKEKEREREKKEKEKEKDLRKKGKRKRKDEEKKNESDGERDEEERERKDEREDQEEEEILTLPSLEWGLKPFDLSRWGKIDSQTEREKRIRMALQKETSSLFQKKMKEKRDIEEMGEMVETFLSFEAVLFRVFSERGEKEKERGERKKGKGGCLFCGKDDDHSFYERRERGEREEKGEGEREREFESEDFEQLRKEGKREKSGEEIIFEFLENEESSFVSLFLRSEISRFCAGEREIERDSLEEIRRGKQTPGIDFLKENLLHLICSLGFFQYVPDLISNNFPTNWRVDGKLPIHYLLASRTDFQTVEKSKVEEVFDLLLENVDISEPLTTGSFGPVLHRGDPLIHTAIRARCPVAIERLVKKGDSGIRRNRSGHWAFCVARMMDYDNHILNLLTCPSDADVCPGCAKKNLTKIMLNKVHQIHKMNGPLSDRLEKISNPMTTTSTPTSITATSDGTPKGELRKGQKPKRRFSSSGLHAISTDRRKKSLRRNAMRKDSAEGPPLPLTQEITLPPPSSYSPSTFAPSTLTSSSSGSPLYSRPPNLDPLDMYFPKPPTPPPRSPSPNSPSPSCPSVSFASAFGPQISVSSSLSPIPFPRSPPPSAPIGAAALPISCLPKRVDPPHFLQNPISPSSTPSPIIVQQNVTFFPPPSLSSLSHGTLPIPPPHPPLSPREYIQKFVAEGEREKVFRVEEAQASLLLNHLIHLYHNSKKDIAIYFMSFDHFKINKEIFFQKIIELISSLKWETPQNTQKHEEEEEEIRQQRHFSLKKISVHTRKRSATATNARFVRKGGEEDRGGKEKRCSSPSVGSCSFSPLSSLRDTIDQREEKVVVGVTSSGSMGSMGSMDLETTDSENTLTAPTPPHSSSPSLYPGSVGLSSPSPPPPRSPPLFSTSTTPRYPSSFTTSSSSSSQEGIAGTPTPTSTTITTPTPITPTLTTTRIVTTTTTPTPITAPSSPKKKTGIPKSVSIPSSGERSGLFSSLHQTNAPPLPPSLPTITFRNMPPTPPPLPSGPLSSFDKQMDPSPHSPGLINKSLLSNLTSTSSQSPNVLHLNMFQANMSQPNVSSFTPTISNAKPISPVTNSKSPVTSSKSPVGNYFGKNKQSDVDQTEAALFILLQWINQCGLDYQRKDEAFMRIVKTTLAFFSSTKVNFVKFKLMRFHSAIEEDFSLSLLNELAIGDKVTARPGVTPLLFDCNTVSSVAVAITYLMSSTFGSMSPSELHDGFQGKDRKTQSPHIHVLGLLFNRIFYLCVVEILCQRDEESRLAAAEKCIELAATLKKMNNFEGMAAVISAFDMASVRRLKPMWRQMKAKLLKKRKKLLQCMDHQLYRDLFRSAKPPLVPWFAPKLRELRYLYDRSDLAGHQWKFDDFKAVGSAISDYFRFKSVKYQLPMPDPLLIHLLEGMESGLFHVGLLFDHDSFEDDMYERSLSYYRPNKN